MSKKTIARKEIKEGEPVQWKTWIKRIGLAIGIPVLFLVIFELILNLAGFGYPAAFFLKSRIQGREYHIENQKYTYRFFPPILARPCIPQALPMEKAPGTVRIFVLGESAARGEPNTSFSFARVLQALLEKRYPAVKFEISNTAIAAVNTHALLPIAENCRTLSPDIYIIYAGNNEVIGPYGPGTVFTGVNQNIDMVRFGLALRTFRTGQLIQGIVSAFAGQGSVPEGWAGLQMFLRHKIRKSDPGMSAVYGAFYRNVKDMALAASGAGASTVLCTVASNLRDCAPFASLNREDLSGPDKEKWDRAYNAGIAEHSAGNRNSALDAFREAEAIDGTHAELLFRIAMCLDGEGKPADAAPYYGKAMEMDTLRFRADQAINGTIRKIAGELQDRKVYLADIERVFFDASPGSIPGQDLFYEHVHMNFAGNYLIAESLLKTVDKILAEKGIKGSDTVLTGEECRRRLVLTPWEEYGMYSNMMSMVKTAPFTGQLNHDGVIRAFNLKIQALEAGIKADGLIKSRDLYQAELKDHPDDVILTGNYGLLLSDALGDSENALVQFNKVLSVLPHDFVFRVNAGTALSRLGRHTEALAEYQEALKYDSQNQTITINLGVTAFQLGRNEEALKYLEKAAALSSNSPEVYIQMAEILLAMKRPGEAEARINQALDLKPGSADLLIKAGSVMSKAGSPDKAVEYFLKAIEADGVSVEAHKQLGVTYFNMNRMDKALFHFQEILRTHPDLVMVRKFAAQAYENRGETDKALAEYKLAIASDPQETEALVRLGKLLVKIRKPAEAAAEIEKALKRGLNGNTEIFLLLGQSQIAAGKTRDALAAMDKAVDSQSNNLSLYNEIGLSFARSGAVKEGLSYFEKALKLKPDFFEARNNLAFALLKLDRTGEAITQYLFLLKARPEMADIHLTLGSLYLKIRDPENAAAHFSEYLKARPNDSKALKGLREADGMKRKIP